VATAPATSRGGTGRGGKRTFVLQEMAAAKQNTAARLFSNAMNSVKEVNQPKVTLQAASGGLGARAHEGGRGLKQLAADVPRQGGGTVRGRGTAVFKPTVRQVEIKAPDAPAASGPVRRQRGVRRSAPYETFNHPLEEMQWDHDQYTGPQPVGSAVFVRSLPKGSTANQVGALFSSAGQVVSVKIDTGPLPTATVGFVRQDAAFAAEKRFHGHWFQGEQLKVSVKDLSSQNVAADDDDFWRRELRDMPKRQRQPTPAPELDFSDDEPVEPVKRQRRGRGNFVAHDDRRVSIFDRLG